MNKFGFKYILFIIYRDLLIQKMKDDKMNILSGKNSNSMKNLGQEEGMMYMQYYANAKIKGKNGN